MPSKQSQRILSFSGLERDYEQSRPSYPDAALSHLHQVVSPLPCNRILDVGCGTGKFTRRLARNFPVCNVFGSDVNADMLAQARRSSTSKKIQYLSFSAEKIPLKSNSFGCVTTAQAIHWFDKAKFFEEAQHLLQPKGWVCVADNVRNWRINAFLEAYEAFLERYSPDYDRDYRDLNYREIMEACGFHPNPDFTCEWTRPMTADRFVQFSCSSTRTQSALKIHGDGILEELRALIKQHYGEANVVVHYTTHLAMGQKTGST
ncbi:class I SAM-dependent methyltransferase [Flexibacterium corallicola]|uniref:class I SAM-dependent methyltransferase n=1 Tax=Flexibacterium corallicola TaxID=3037259 RepID=UPI00286F1C28|nr:class I SAM-dependent methyltransferase [Pseudovibrio sp. M1P-2-3]